MLVYSKIILFKDNNMKILFYSNKCKFCIEIISKLKESEVYDSFKLINIDDTKVPSKIKVVPTIIDSEIKDLLEGKKAFEYLYNNKYFNIPTNNFLLWKDKSIPKPDIKEDSLAKNESLDLLDSQKIYITQMEKNKEEVVVEKKKVRITRNNLFMIRGRNK